MKYWRRQNPDGSTLHIESEDEIEGATEITKEEFDDFVASLPGPAPPRNLAQEIDEMKAKMVTSEPPDGMARVSNIYYDPTAKEIQHIEGV